MLFCFRCDCGGAEGLIRRALERGGVQDWLKHPIYVGKEASLSYIDQALSEIADDIEVRSLRRFISEASKFAVVLGVKNGKIRWANLSDSSPAAKLDAEVIIDKLA